MTSFSDERPLSRRELREKLRAQQAQDSVLQSAAASKEKEAKGDQAEQDASKAEKPPASGVSSPTAKEIGREASSSGHEDTVTAQPSVAADLDRPLTRRELRALRAETGMTPVVTHDDGASRDEKSASADEESRNGDEQLSVPVEDSSDDASQESEAGASKPLSAKVANRQDTTGPDSSDETDQSPRVSDAFSAKPKVDSSAGAAEAARAFDTLIAPEARGSDVLTTSSVLLLPGAPGAGSTSKATGTGEIIVTGSMDLPQSDGKGDRAASERPDVDSGADNSGEGTATAGTPVSATRAVSTHAVTRDVITPPTKTSSSKLLMILAITAGVLCVAVIGVVIVGLLTDSF